MFGAIAIGLAYLIAKKLDDAGDYKTPKGKNKNRYKQAYYLQLIEYEMQRLSKKILSFIMRVLNK